MKKKGVSFDVGSIFYFDIEFFKLSSLIILSGYGIRDFREVVREIKDEFEVVIDYGKEVFVLFEVGKELYRFRNIFLKGIIISI